MKYFKGAKFILALVAGLCASHAAFAGTSDWMIGSDVHSYTLKIAAEGMIVTRMECKDSGKLDLDINSAYVRLTYAPNTKRTGWRLDGWVNLQENQEFWKSMGYKLVSHTVFERKRTGLRLYCMIYHKN